MPSPDETMPVVAALRFFPIKSCGGVALDRAYVGPRGLEVGKIGDRRWMLADAEGMMVTQRQIPDLARVKVSLVGDALRVEGDELPPLMVDPAEVGAERGSVILHRKETVGHYSPAAVNDWFSRFLGKPVRLLYQTDADIRLCDAHFAVAPGSDKLGFADAYPYLLAGSATLDRLNSLLASRVPMNRFRPNIVVDGAEPDAEYSWKELAIGEVRLSIVKPSDRCVMTTIDQTSGRKTGKEPLATLARAYFLSADFGKAHVQGAIFGENVIATQFGMIRVGDPIAVLAQKPRHSFRAEDGSDSVADL